jgi:hypothetical protein
VKLSDLASTVEATRQSNPKPALAKTADVWTLDRVQQATSKQVVFQITV